MGYYRAFLARPEHWCGALLRHGMYGWKYPKIIIGHKEASKLVALGLAVQD